MHFVVLALAVIAAQPKLAAPKKSAPAGAGNIDVKTLNPGAKVFLDDKQVGTAPMTIKNVVAGDHKVKLKKLGYLAGEQVVKVVNGKNAEAQIDLLPYAGIFNVTTKPKGAQVFIDGKGVGVTPFEGEISIGRRNVEVKKDGFATYREQFQVAAGESYKIDTALTKLEGEAAGEVPLAALSPKKKKGDESPFMDIPLEAPPALTPIARTPSQGPLSGGDLNASASRNDPLYKKWWLWTIVGAVVIGGAVAIGVGVGTAPPPQTLDFTGEVNFPAR